MMGVDLRKQNSTEEIANVIFYIGLCIFVFNELMVLSLADISPIVVTLLRYFSYALFIVKIFMTKYERVHIIMFGIVLAVMGISFVVNGVMNFLVFTIIIFAAHNTDFKGCIKAVLIAQTAVLVIVLMGAYLGLIYNHVMVQHNLEDGSAGRVREYLGFNYATYAPNILLFILMGYVYLKDGALRVYEYVTFTLAAYLLYYYTDTNFAFVLTCVVMVITALFKNLKKGEVFFEKVKWPIVSMPFLVAVFSIALQMMYDGEKRRWVKLSKMVRSRIRLGYEAFEKYGITLFGNKVEWVGHRLETSPTSTYNYVDCAYMQVLIQYGLIPLLVLLGLYSVIIYRMYKNKMYGGIFLIMCILVYQIMEARPLALCFNAFVLLAVTCDSLKTE